MYADSDQGPYAIESTTAVVAGVEIKAQYDRPATPDEISALERDGKGMAPRRTLRSAG